MRLICPNCDAQYEVDDGAIPEAGRDVQCSNCGHAWFQMREVRADDPADDLYRDPEPVADVPDAVAQTGATTDDDAAPPPAVDGVAPVARTLDASVLSILREEADRELAARKAEAAGGLEMQGDLGLPPPVSPMVGSAAAAPMTATGRRIASLKGESVPAQRTGSRRDLLPDIEEINSTLRPNEAAASLDDTGMPAPEASGSGFRSGFSLVLIVTGLALAVYIMAPQISAQIPGAADALTSYVAAVDGLRLTLDQLMQRATQAMNGTTNG
jgi:predicted Zn finger-like uncharacterized protein